MALDDLAGEVFSSECFDVGYEFLAASPILSPVAFCSGDSVVDFTVGFPEEFLSDVESSILFVADDIDESQVISPVFGEPDPLRLGEWAGYSAFLADWDVSLETHWGRICVRMPVVGFLLGSNGKCAVRVFEQFLWRTK